jgi:hypothetical protein
MTERRRSLPRVPAHVFLMLGASAAGYAVTLAGVAGFQSQAETAIAEARGPALAALDAAASANDQLGVRFDRARAQYAFVAGTYDVAGATLDELRAELGDLAAIVEKIQGESRALPTAVRLPAVRTTVPAVRTPVTHATTRASGG